MAGAADEVTAAEAVQAWRSVRFRPRVLRDVRDVDTRTTLLGTTYRLPVGPRPRSRRPDGLQPRGRQLDRAMATADALPQVVAAVSADAQVYVDGGVRSGLDVLAALALGADAVSFGRLPLLALAAGGAENLSAVIETLAGELVGGMRLAGLTRPREASDELVGTLWPGSRRSDLTVP